MIEVNTWLAIEVIDDDSGNSVDLDLPFPIKVSTDQIFPDDDLQESLMEIARRITALDIYDCDFSNEIVELMKEAISELSNKKQLRLSAQKGIE